MIAIFRSGEQPLKQQEVLSLIQNKWVPIFQSCAKLVGFEANIGFEIEISQKYRYRIGIGYEIARIWTSILILFRNCELIDIGFELLHVGILHQLRANL